MASAPTGRRTHQRRPADDAPSPADSATAGRTPARESAAPTIPTLVRDGAAAAVVCAASIAALAASDEPGARATDLGAYALLVAGAAPLALRRRWPLAALGAVAAMSLSSFALGYPGGPVTLPVMAAIYAAAEAGQRRWAWLVTGLFAGGGAAFRALIEHEPLVTVALNSALFVLVALLGDLVHSRRALRQEVRDRLQQAQAEREREAQRRVVDERVRIARELHDVTAHTIATMTVQAGAAADCLDEDPERARAALRTLRDGARQAMSELRATVAVLRDGDQPSPLVPAPSLADLPALIESVRQEGLHVELRDPDSATAETAPSSEAAPSAAAAHGPDAAPALPAATHLTAYRIVQEALTNVIRHAHATSATITVERRPDALIVEISDDGRGPDLASAPGFGQQGMRERAEALGGHLEAGPRRGGGYRVKARLPTGGSER